MKQRFMEFMQGRYGADQLSKFLTGAGLVCAVLTLLTGWRIFYGLFWILLIYSYFRMFSKNHMARYQENQKFLGWKNRITYWWSNRKKIREQKKIYHIYSCPFCKQKIRIPKGKGSIIITCPKCKQEFGKRS